MQIVKREGASKKQIILIRLIAIIAAIVVSGIFIVFLGYNPVKVYLNMVSGALGSKIRFRSTLLEMVPLVITSLGILVAFKMKFWNIGGEGQILMGAFAATYIALYVEWIPKPLVIPVMFIVGFLAGGVWGLIPAFFKAKFGANETIMTLMLNYIATQWITYLQYGPWRDPSLRDLQKSPTFRTMRCFQKYSGFI